VSDNGNPSRVYLGTYEGGTTHLIIPRDVLASAEQKLAVERARREAAIADAERVKARLRNTRRARIARRFRRALAMFARLPR
jgi:hypothetical protein